jgi:hypothetical protein
VVVVEGQPELLEVVAALDACRRLADLLDGGQEQADQDGDDRYHHQQLDQREPRSPPAPGEELSEQVRSPAGVRKGLGEE